MPPAEEGVLSEHGCVPQFVRSSPTQVLGGGCTLSGGPGITLVRYLSGLTCFLRGLFLLISRACETLGKGGPKSVDLSANVLPFLVINLAYLISASRLTRAQPGCWPPDLALYPLHYYVKKI